MRSENGEGCLLLSCAAPHCNRRRTRGSMEMTKVIIALAKNAGYLQNGSHMLLFLLASFAKQA